MKKVIAAALALVFSGAAFAGDQVHGSWNCMMVSDYGDFQFELTLNGDSTYANKQSMFGSVSIDSGNWRLDGDVLVMHRTKTNENGVEEDSDFEFRREIASVSGDTLVLHHDDVVTTCKKM